MLTKHFCESSLLDSQEQTHEAGIISCKAPLKLKELTNSGQALRLHASPVTNREKCPDLSLVVGTEGSNSQLLERQRKKKGNPSAISRAWHWQHNQLVMEDRLFYSRILLVVYSSLPKPAWNSTFI